MAKIKLSELPELTSPSSNTENTFVLVTDIQSGTPLSRKMSVKTLDTLIDVTQTGANAAFARANASFNHANAAFDRANSGSNIATNLAVTGNTTITSNVRVGGNITPTTTLTSNLGNASSRFHSLFLGPNSLDIDGFVVSNFNNEEFRISNARKIVLTNGFDVNQQANAAFNHANAAFIVANAAGGGGTTDTYARNHSNSSFDHANAAFVRANNSLDANNGGDVFGTVSFYGNIQGYNGTANVNHLHVQQPYIYINAGGQSPVDGRMNIVFQRGSSYFGVPNAVIGFNETSNTFQMTNGSGVFANIAFEPYTAANLSTSLWATSPPATLQAAIERLANAVIILRGYDPIP